MSTNASAVVLIAALLLSPNRLAADELWGRVDIDRGLYKEALSGQFLRDFKVVAAVAGKGARDASEVQVDDAGKFRLQGVNASAEVQLRWEFAEESRKRPVVLWPLVHPPRMRSPYNAFRLKRLSDVIQFEVRASSRGVEAALHANDWSRARDLMDSLLGLLRRYPDNQAVLGRLTASDYQFVTLRDVAALSAERRAGLASEATISSALEIERNWRREILKMAEFRRSPVEVAVALNGWAQFSISYLKQLHWPGKTLDGVQGTLFRESKSREQVNEDLSLVLKALANPAIRKVIVEVPAARESRLSGPQRTALTKWRSRAEVPESGKIDMNSLMNLLSAVFDLSGAGDQASMSRHRTTGGL